MLFTTDWLLTIFPNEKTASSKPISIQEVNTDSRVQTKNSLFIPIVGDHFDGHAYAKQAIDHGSVAILWNENQLLPSFIKDDFPVFYVKDTLIALQYLATEFRKKINPLVIGITGSNGKTTTKDIVASVLKTTYKTHCTDGNFNNHIGLPLTILSMPIDTEVLVLEMGMNDFGEIDLLSNIAEPDYAVITNIGESHIEFLGSVEGITKAKLEIKNGLKENGVMIIDGDEPLLKLIHKNNQVITSGFQSTNKHIIGNVLVTEENTAFKLNDHTEYTIPLLGEHQAKNASYAIILGEYLNIPINKIKAGLLSLELSGMRFELFKGKNGVTIINDAYNASPTSMKAAIQIVMKMDGYSEKVLVLGDVLELGSHSQELHESIAKVIKSPITAVFTFGDECEVISKKVLENNPNMISKHFSSKSHLIKALQSYLNDQSLLLFKASRGMEFECLVEQLQK